MAKTYRNVDSRADFPIENPIGLWGEPYTKTRYDGSTYRVGGIFQMHRNLSLVKAAITNMSGDGTTERSWRAYELDRGEWLEIEHIPAGIFFRTQHPLWKNGAAPKGKQAVSDEAVAEAIKSILGTTETEA